MSKRNAKSHRPVKSRGRSLPSGESRVGDATTVAWTMAVTTTLLCEVSAVAAYFYTQSFPGARGVTVLRELLLFAAAVIGLLSLALLPAVFRARKAPPPSGITVFALCVAMAPILALIVRNLR